MINILILDGGDVIEAGGNQIKLIEVVLSVRITNPYSFYTYDMATKISPLTCVPQGPIYSIYNMKTIAVLYMY